MYKNSPKAPYYQSLVNPYSDKIVQTNYGSRIHPNPYYWKYQWRVFYQNSPEGELFGEQSPLSTYEAMNLIKILKSNDEPFHVTNWKLPRKDDNNPFDISNARWKNQAFAPSFDDDADRVWYGFK